MKHRRRIPCALALVLCLLAELCVPMTARAAENLTTGPDGVALVKRYEGFSDTAYERGGRWYIGYGTSCAEGAYPDGISEDEAETLLRDALGAAEKAVNAFCGKNGVEPSQGQFDALVSFTYNLGTNWLNGDSALVQIAAGRMSADRLETAQAFLVWCHVGGKADETLARRRLEEAALYLDGTTDAAREELAFVAVEKESGVEYRTDVAVYERGKSCESFPVGARLGYTAAAVEAADGTRLRLGETVEKNIMGRVVWEKNVYSKRSFTDVSEESWFYDYVMELSEKDVINGYGEGIYHPGGEVKVGEALKLVLLCVGCDAQPSQGEHWADGYAALARESGYLGSGVLSDLNAPIRRRDVAHLAARALGFGQSIAKTPFSDTDDGYVTALYEIGVLTGETDGGKRIFRPESGISRAEIATIIWRLSNAVALGRSQSVTYKSGNRTLAVDTSHDVPTNDIVKDGFTQSGSKLSYEYDGVTSKLGVDVSRFQGDVDWEAVRAEGVEFAILRVGGRYQTTGELYADVKFESNYRDARAAGITVGVYFYSQAISAEEAEEEADYVLNAISGKDITGPVVFDWETAGNSSARTNGVSSATLATCAAAYCDRVREAGYSPMIYMNSYDGYVRYDLTRLQDYDIWFATAAPSSQLFYYRFEIWQYSDKGSLKGIDGRVDMDIWFIRE